MVKMISLAYPLILSLSILSQGFLFSVSKSIRKSENDDMLLDTITLRKAFRSGDSVDKSAGSPNEHYKTADNNIINDEDERSLKTIGPQHNFFSHDGLSLNPGMKQMPYLALKSSLNHPDTEDQIIDLTQERRDLGEEETAGKIPVGRRDFDILVTSFKALLTSEWL
ncbi:pro-MCH [Bombina bombina]|uniref:pro-MCH n=1 Tax=Bombina bombina TaxID=8345 RepID=UPI00235AE620|nr:pro-MCH [Bombina bombina]